MVAVGLVAGCTSTPPPWSPARRLAPHPQQEFVPSDAGTVYRAMGLLTDTTRVRFVGSLRFLAGATPDGGLRSYASMTYAGLKSFLYAGVSKDDPRVKAAVDWIRKHYTLDENPGLGQKGLYYYYHVFAKAMDALGENPFADAKGTKHAWKRELFDALAKRQQADGGWRNAADKTFGEADPNLATGFAVLAVSYCYTRK